MGIALRHFEDFLGNISRDVDWDVLCLREFSGRRSGVPSSMWFTNEGHQVFQQSPMAGRKIGALIVHARHVAFVVLDSFRSVGRSCFLDVVLCGHRLRLINAHLDPGHVNAEHLYSNDCDIVDNIIRTTPKHFQPILCADAQDQLGPLHMYETSGILGEFALGPRGDKGDMFLTMCCLNSMPVWNTCFASSQYTCHHFGRTEPNQIDFIAGRLGKRRVHMCKTLETSATVTDHRPVVLTLHSAGRVPAFRCVDRGPGKPVRWRLENFEFNDFIRTRLQLPLPGEENNVARGLHVYTDGSCTMGTRKVCKAGWGFAVYDVGDEPSDDSSLIREAHGPVVLDTASQYFVGAGKKTNNTGEMSAIIEVLLFLLSECQAGNLFHHKLGTTIIIHSDSKYSIGVATGKFKPRENVGMGNLLRHLFIELSRFGSLHLVWVKAHAGNYGNTIADSLADKGADYLHRAAWWNRPYRLKDWGQNEYMLRMTGVQEAKVSISPSARGAPTYTKQSFWVDDSTLTLDRVDADGESVPLISEFTSAISLAGQACGRGRGRGSKLPENLLKEVKEVSHLRSSRNDQEDPGLRHELTLQLCRASRSLKRSKASWECSQATSLLCLPSPFKKSAAAQGRVYTLRNLGDPTIIYDTPEDICKHTLETYTALFLDPSGEDLPNWIYKRWKWVDLDAFREINGAFLKEIILGMAAGKTCASDLVVAEMLQQLDDDLLDVLAVMFRLRLLNHYSEDSEASWNDQVLNLVKKKVRVEFIKDFRPITILPVLEKVYAILLLKLTGGKCDLLEAPQFAFRRGHQAHEVVFILRQLVEKCLEWNQAVFILDGDIQKAYDYTRHPRMIEALLWKGVRKIVVAAIIREIRRSKVSVIVDQVTKTDPISRTRSVPQGDPGMPTYFNATLDKPAAVFLKICQDREWGFRLADGTFLGILLFADNYWLIARSNVVLTEMLAKWLELLRLWGWNTPHEELSYGTTLADSVDDPVFSDGIQIRRVKRNLGFPALGCQITFDGRNGAELKARIAKCWKAFGKFSPILCNSSSPWGKRVAMLGILLENCLFWCSGSWMLDNRLLSNLNAVQGQMLRKMLGKKYEPSMTPEDYVRECSKTLKHLKQKHNFIDWDMRVLKHHFGWAGHVSRLRALDPARITHRILSYRDARWLRLIESQNNEWTTASLQKFQGLEMGATFGEMGTAARC